MKLTKQQRNNVYVEAYNGVADGSKYCICSAILGVDDKFFQEYDSLNISLNDYMNLTFPEFNVINPNNGQSYWYDTYTEYGREYRLNALALMIAMTETN